MNRLKVYLSGAVKQVEEDFQNWRNKCLELSENGFYPNLKFIDPNSYFNYTNKLPETDRQCLDLFMWQAEESDILLVNLDHSNCSIGSGMEVEHAYCCNIPIIAFGSKPDTWYPWIETRATVIFYDLEDALEYINDSYGEVVK